MKTTANPLQTLQHYFGYDAFREGQREVIDNTLAGRDAFVAMRTGGGKSLCYQIPALCLPGTALVISPLIALMKDQVDALLKRDIPAAALNSNMSAQEVRDTLTRARAGEYKLLYIAPERFDSESFQRALNDIKVSFVAVDEAHCISVWGHDFRLAYRRLPDALNALDKAVGRRLPRIALTATATPAVREDVTSQLELRDPTSFMLGYDRDNLTLLVQNLRSGEDKDQALLDYLATRPKGEPTIIYSATIKAMPGIAAVVSSSGRSVTIYNGRLLPEERKANQDKFLAGEVDVIVATNAFGMGIDKADIREVIHYHMPASLENYYQEVGRGGRDGKPARGLLLCQRATDERLQRFFIDGNHPRPESVRALHSRLREWGVQRREVSRSSVTHRIPGATAFQDEALLRRIEHTGMIDYQAGATHDTWMINVKNPDAPLDLGDLPAQRRTAEANLEAMIRFTTTHHCRRRELLLHFGEENPPKRCGQCDRCLDSGPVRSARPAASRDPDEVSPAALQVLLKLVRQANRPLTVDEASQILLGVRDARLIQDGFTQLDAFGRLKHYNQGKLWGLFAHVSRHGLMSLQDTCLALTERGNKALQVDNPNSLATLAGAVKSLAEDNRRNEARRVDAGLKAALVRERQRLARREGVNTMMIASEAALNAIARIRPASKHGLSKTGLNHAQLERFGHAFLRCVKNHAGTALEVKP